jgi:hypothetical protein
MQIHRLCASGAAKVRPVFPMMTLQHPQHRFSGTVHAWHLDVNVTSHRESLSKNASVLLDNGRSSAQIRVGAAVLGVCTFAAPDGQAGGGSIAIINEKGRLEVSNINGTSTTNVISR